MIKTKNPANIGFARIRFGDPTGNRTRVTAVKGRCLNRLTIGPEYYFCEIIRSFMLVLKSQRSSLYTKLGCL